MKKFLAVLLVITLCVAFSACGGSTSNDNIDTATTTATNTTETATDTETTVEEIVSEAENTEANSVDTGTTNESIFVLEGKEISLPISAKTLIGYGWEIPEGALNETLKSDEGAKYFFSLYKDGQAKVRNAAFFNNSASTASLDNCDVISLTLIGKSSDADEYQCTFSLVGGITQDSTYEDVLAVFGTEDEPKQEYTISNDYDPADEGTESFEKYGFLYYVYGKYSDGVHPYNYIFTFNSDKTIESVEIESVNYQSAALSAFN